MMFIAILGSLVTRLGGSTPPTPIKKNLIKRNKSMSHVTNMLILLGIILGCPIGYYFCKFKYRNEIKAAEVK